ATSSCRRPSSNTAAPAFPPPFLSGPPLSRHVCSPLTKPFPNFRAIRPDVRYPSGVPTASTGGPTMTSTLDVGRRLVELCREGKFLEAINTLYSPDIVSIEVHGSDQMPAR